MDRARDEINYWEANGEETLTLDLRLYNKEQVLTRVISGPLSFLELIQGLDDLLIKARDPRKDRNEPLGQDQAVLDMEIIGRLQTSHNGLK